MFHHGPPTKRKKYIQSGILICNFIKYIDQWMVNSRLKTELLLLSSKFRARPCLDSVPVVEDCISPSFSAKKNLGVTFDQYLNVD